MGRWGHTIPLEVFLPAVIFPGLIFNIFIVWPFIEASQDQGPGVPQPPRPAPGPSQADGDRRGHADAPVHDVLRLVDRRDGQLLPDPAQRGAVVLPVRRASSAPIVAYFVAYKICHEMRAAEGIGKRKRALIVSRSARASTRRSSPSPARATSHEELDAIPVPTFIDPTDPELATGGRRPTGHPLAANV